MAYTTIKKPSSYFNTVTYTGDGTNGQNITGINFKPDLCWIKSRTAAQEHMWYDAVRGNDKLLRSNNTAGDATTSTTTYFNSFDSDGFTVGSETALGANGANFVGWNWLASNTTASNTDGSISSTVSANTTSGFSIVSYTGTGANATVGHGLGATPKVIIVKNRTDVADWLVYHGSLGTPVNEYLKLNATDATGSNANTWNTNPTSTVFGLGSVFGALNGSSKNYIAYCFAEKQGFSKFGSYVGNGNADGTFVYTGFKPAMVILKDYTSVSNYNWVILDNKRDPLNGLDRRLQPSSAFAEYTDVSDFCDFTSNGFKWRGSQANWNGSGVGYIYMAFAEEPLVGDNPATAR